MGEGTKRDQNTAALKLAVAALSMAAGALADVAAALGQALDARGDIAEPAAEPVVVPAPKPQRKTEDVRRALHAELRASVEPKPEPLAPPLPVPMTEPPKAEGWQKAADRLFAGGKGQSINSISKQLGVAYHKLYRHLNPEYAQRHREQAAERYRKSHAPADAPVPEAKAPPKVCRPRSAPIVVAPTPIPASSAPPPLSAEHDEAIPVELNFPTDGPGLHILALRGQHCRWPVGAGSDGQETYCGCARSMHGGSYCEEHSVRAHNPGCWPPSSPLRRPTRMPKPISVLPAARNL